MEIKTKLSIGDKVYPIWVNSKEIEIKCDACDGLGEVLLSNESFICPKCWGKGYKIDHLPSEWRYADYKPNSKVKRIDIEVVGKDVKVKYFPWGTSGSYFDENNCFATKEEMEEEIAKRNLSLVAE